jgi:ABC-type multidrug transport system ATPase subunit
MFGLLGRNGAGKSTLMRILATLQEPDAGSARLLPSSGSEQVIDVLRQKHEVRRTLGYLPQSFGFHPRARAERLLEHFAVLKGIGEPGVRRDVVESLLRQTNLWEVRGQRLGTFSGGMRQRFGVAVALLGNPKLIIVDEPTAGLDPEERVRFLNLLSRIGEDSVVILSTHIVEDVEELCSRMAIIDGGEILLEAEPLRAIDALRGRIWRRTVSRDELAAVERELPVISTRLLGGRTIVHVHAEASPGTAFEPVDPALEDVYFSVMAGHHGRRAVEAAGAEAAS